VVDLIPDLNNISLENWDHPVFREHELHADILRLDKIHPEISGNKWFKLKYYLRKAKEENKHTLISFGGAYSNHILALAAAAAMNGFASMGLIRGEESRPLSHTMASAKEFGMKLQFLSRPEYNDRKNSEAKNNPDLFTPDTLLIPEGGAGDEGIRGAEDILSVIPFTGYSHICCAVGTGATLAGLINRSERNQKIIGVSVLKGTRDLNPLDPSWINNKSKLDHVSIIHQDHFGGYAKYNQLLLDFMNDIFTKSGIPTDFVYTGKLFYSIVRMAGDNFFPVRGKILILHTGGIQGNRSLPPGLLQF